MDNLKNELLKVGDKIMVVTFSRYHENSVKVVKIVKVNKTTYKLSNGDLIYIENLNKREARDVWGGTFYKYEIFDDEKYKEIKNEFTEEKYKNFVKDFEARRYNLNFVKRYIEESRKDGE